MRQLSGALFRVVKPQDPGTHDLVWCENRGSSGFCVNYTVCNYTNCNCGLSLFFSGSGSCTLFSEVLSYPADPCLLSGIIRVLVFLPALAALGCHSLIRGVASSRWQEAGQAEMLRAGNPERKGNTTLSQPAKRGGVSGEVGSSQQGLLPVLGMGRGQGRGLSDRSGGSTAS